MDMPDCQGPGAVFVSVWALNFLLSQMNEWGGRAKRRSVPFGGCVPGPESGVRWLRPQLLLGGHQANYRHDTRTPYVRHPLLPPADGLPTL